MDKRYQVFVSSTYADLQEERQKVIQTLMEMDCIPAGMELFPAADEEQWEFIKRIIDDCDYYILIIGGRYGSLTAEGISYTEQEYDYAMSVGLRVLAFVHDVPDEIPVGKSDIVPELRAKLEAFRERVSKSRIVKFWTNATELPGLVALSLSKTIKVHPAVGWVRADSVASDDLLIDMNAVRKENEQLRLTVSDLEARVSPEEVYDLAPLDDVVKVTIEYYGGGYLQKIEVCVTWANMFACIAPELLKHPSDESVGGLLGAALHRRHTSKKVDGGKVQRDDFQTVRTQLVALDLIAVRYAKATTGEMGLFWSMTKRGQALMMQLRTVKAGSNGRNEGDKRVLGD